MDITDMVPTTARTIIGISRMHGSRQHHYWRSSPDLPILASSIRKQPLGEGFGVRKSWVVAR